MLFASLAFTAVAFGVPKRVLGVLLALFAVFGVVNAHGRFHPTKLADWQDPNDPRPLVSNDGWLLERSLEYRDDLALNRDLARRASGLKNTIVVASWPLMHALLVPEFGYVDRPLAVACAETPIDQGPPVVSMAEVLRAATSVPPQNVLWILTPNVFGGPRSQLLPGDRVLATIESGRLRAFVIQRQLQ